MTLNKGYTYREQLGPNVVRRSTLTYLVDRYKHSSEAIWQQRLVRGEILLDGSAARGDEALRAGQILIWNRPPWREEDVPRHFELIYKDEALIVVNKPSGLPSLPAGGFLSNTLLAVVNETYPEAKPLHRLGRATSGLVLFACVPEAARALSQRWQDVKKSYRALAQGIAVEQNYDMTAAIGPVPHPHLGSVFAASKKGKSARSKAAVLERRREATLFKVDLVTGRPHQIRIHLAYIGHPLVGEPLYGVGGKPLPSPGLPGAGGYFLHAETLKFIHPLSNERLELHAPVPAKLELQES